MYDTVFSLDALSVTIFAGRDFCRRFMADIGFVDMTDTGHGTRGYTSVLVGSHGARLGCWPNGVDAYCTVSLMGQALRAVTVDKVMAVLRDVVLAGTRVQVSRMDLAFDTRDFVPGDVLKAFTSGKTETRTTRMVEWSVTEEGERTGHTVYFGSRKSDLMLRVYDKRDGISFGQDVAFTRVELECKGKRANAFFRELFALELNEWQPLAVGFLRSFFDIKLSWWDNFCHKAKKAWVVVRHAVSSINKLNHWLEQQCAPSLAAVVYAKSGANKQEALRILWRMMYLGFSRYDKAKQRAVNEYREESMLVMSMPA